MLVGIQYWVDFLGQILMLISLYIRWNCTIVHWLISESQSQLVKYLCFRIIGRAVGYRLRSVNIWPFGNWIQKLPFLKVDLYIIVVLHMSVIFWRVFKVVFFSCLKPTEILNFSATCRNTARSWESMRDFSCSKTLRPREVVINDVPGVLQGLWVLPQRPL